MEKFIWSKRRFLIAGLSLLTIVYVVFSVSTIFQMMQSVNSSLPFEDIVSPYIGSVEKAQFGTLALVAAFGLLIVIIWTLAIRHIKKSNSISKPAVPILMIMVLLASYSLPIKGAFAATATDTVIDVLGVGDQYFDANYPQGYSRYLAWEIYINDAFAKFETTFGLTFRFRGWISWHNDIPSYPSPPYEHGTATVLMLDEAIRETGFVFQQTTYSGYYIDLLMCFSASPNMDMNGLSPPDWNAMIIFHGPDAPRNSLLMHETTHQFYIADGQCSSYGSCCMAVDEDSFGGYMPAQWCSNCINRINTEGHKWRFNRTYEYDPGGDGGGGGGGGGCPFVSVWNGSDYVLDNNLIPAAEHSNGTDVIDYYKLQQSVAWEDGKYSLKVWDLDKHSFLDQVRLLAIDHGPDINIAVSPYGEVLTYKNPTPAVSAVDQDNQSVTSILSAVDGNYFEGYAGDSILLDFGDLNVSDGAKLVLRTDANCEFPCKVPYSIHILNATGSWINVTSVIPRIYWSTDIVDLSDYLPDGNGDLKLKLYFTAYHKIDFVGLDTTEQEEFETHYGNLAIANHTRLGDVKELLRDSDNLHVELLPGEQVLVQFTLPQNDKEERDLIIILEGHYFILG